MPFIYENFICLYIVTYIKLFKEMFSLFYQ